MDLQPILFLQKWNWNLFYNSFFIEMEVEPSFYNKSFFLLKWNWNHLLQQVFFY